MLGDPVPEPSQLGLAAGALALFAIGAMRTRLKTAFTVGVIDGDDPSHPEDTGYGYGWTIDMLRGQREISHGSAATCRAFRPTTSRLSFS